MTTNRSSIPIDVPGFGRVAVEHLVCDYNGTLACDGVLLPEVEPLLRKLAEHVQIHVVTADTFGLAREQLAGLPVRLVVLPKDNQDERKAEFVRELGAATTVAVGNGRNDALMLQEAAVGICLVQREGAAAAAMQSADVVCLAARDALELLLEPKRLVATLRR